uniref:Uncharacterized protein n=1 Tax=Melopsittacus undulatus TaxID=13146 RepID=A0A8V5GWM8_MELUD
PAPSGRCRQSQRQRRERAAAQLRAQQDFGSVPHSFVFLRGRGGRSLRLLVADMRRVLEPFTARALRVRKSNSLKDFVAVAGPLGVTHFLVFSKSESSINLVRPFPYSLLRDVVSALRRHRMHEQQFRHPPLLVLSSFGLPQSHIRLMASTFQNLLPSINVHRVRRSGAGWAPQCDRAATGLCGQGQCQGPAERSAPDRGLCRSPFPSDPIPIGSHSHQIPFPLDPIPIGIRHIPLLFPQIGPRLTLQLNKVEEGLAQGNVLYHSFSECC